MDAHEQLAGALNLMQLAPNARQPRIYPPQSGGLADSTGTDSREGYTSPYGPGEASTTERKRSDEGAVAVVDGGEAKKGGKKRKNHRGGKKNKKGDNIPAANDTDNAAKEEQDTLSKLYDIKHAAGKGFGVFANQDIKRGTRIMSEQPLLTVPPQTDVPTAFSELSRHDQGLFLSVHCRQYNAGDMDSLTALREKPIEGLDMLTFPVELQAKVIAIHRTNFITAGEKTVVCVKVSRLNHSCLPNAHHQWNENIGAVTVHAMKDIATGEEVVITYVPLCLDRATRTARLGFKCICAACDASTAFGEASEMRRKILSLIDDELVTQRWLTAHGVYNDHREDISAVIKSMKLLEEEGIDGWEMTRRFFRAKPQI
jgi:hypothetical protein